MTNMSRFQIILTGIFAFFIIAGVFVFAISGRSGEERATLLVWGSVPQSIFESVISKLPIAKDKTISITYVYKKDEDFDNDFIEALASGVGPDVVVIAQDSMIKHRKKLMLIPFESYSERQFKDTFVEEGEIFIEQGGFIAFPFLIDPLVMYWNRDIFSGASLSQPPRYWDEFYNLSKDLTRKDGSLNITRATIALGEYGNIQNAKEILSTLIFQAGNPDIVKRVGDGYDATLENSYNQQISPSQSAINFYTEFSNPTKSHYSWNRSLPNSQTMFLSGDLAAYFGFSSEAKALKLKNPNLNFDVAPIPQTRTSERVITFGKIQGLAVTRTTKSLPASFKLISAISTAQAAQEFSNATGLPPVRRDLLAKGSTDGFQALFFKSAIWSQGWLDPERAKTDKIFQEMIESITGGRARTEQAVARAQAEITKLLQP